MSVQSRVIRELTNRIEVLEKEVRFLRLSLVRKGMLEEGEANGEKTTQPTLQAGPQGEAWPGGQLALRGLSLAGSDEG